MQDIAQPLTFQRAIVACVTIAMSLGTFVLLQTFEIDFSHIKNVGFPLVFDRNDIGTEVESFSTMVFASSVLHRFFPTALAFDLVVGALVTGASGYCTYLWSGSWSTRGGIAYVLTCLGFGILLSLGRWIPLPIGIVLLFVLLIAIPIACIYCVGYVSWICGKHLLGTNAGMCAPLVVAAGIWGIGWWCYPHDILYDRTPNDIPALIRLLSDNDPRVRLRAISALRGLGPYDEPSASAIIQAMSDPDKQVQSNAISLASDLGPSSATAVPILIEQFIENGGCTFELGQLGPIAEEAIPALKSKLENADGYGKLGICEALWAIEKNPSVVVPPLIELLSDDFGPIRVDAASMLGSIGPEARDAVPLLEAMVAHVPKDDAPPPIDIALSFQTPRPASEFGVPFPSIRPMPESEFYPRIRAAAQAALVRIRPRGAIAPVPRKSGET